MPVLAPEMENYIPGNLNYNTLGIVFRTFPTRKFPGESFENFFSVLCSNVGDGNTKSLNKSGALTEKSS